MPEGSSAQVSVSKEGFRWPARIALVLAALNALILTGSVFLEIFVVVFMGAYDDPRIKTVSDLFLTLAKGDVPLVLLGPVALITSAVFYRRNRYLVSFMVSLSALVLTFALIASWKVSA